MMQDLFDLLKIIGIRRWAVIKIMDRLWLYARTKINEAPVENKQFKSMSVQISGATVSLQYEDAEELEKLLNIAKRAFQEEVKGLLS